MGGRCHNIMLVCGHTGQTTMRTPPLYIDTAALLVQEGSAGRHCTKQILVQHTHTHTLAASGNVQVKYGQAHNKSMHSAALSQLYCLASTPQDRSGCAFLLKGPLPAIQCLKKLGMLYPRMILMTLMPIIMHQNQLFGGGIKIEHFLVTQSKS